MLRGVPLRRRNYANFAFWKCKERGNKAGMQRLTVWGMAQGKGKAGKGGTRFDGVVFMGMHSLSKRIINLFDIVFCSVLCLKLLPTASYLLLSIVRVFYN